jgi:hypothetical protein
MACDGLNKLVFSDRADVVSLRRAILAKAGFPRPQ